MMEERAAALTNTGTTCPDEDEIVALLAGALSTRPRGAVHAHLDTCETCRRLVAAAARQDDREAGVPRKPAEDGEIGDERPRSFRVDRHGPDADRPPLLPSGATLARYVILGAIGSGAMGVVYSAYDPELDRKVAIKLLRTRTAGADDERDRRVLREAQAMARLSHPNVVAVYDVGVVDGQVFLVMEFVQGATLTRWLASGARPFRAVLDVLRRAGSGLAAAHGAGLVHRDFKPDNVLIDRAGRVLVADFGLARAAGEESAPVDASSLIASRFTRTGAIVGTPAYMAPEQLDGGEVDARSDVFSFCVTLHEALYGERPFSGTTVKELREAIARGPTSEPKDRARIPGWVRPIVLAGLRVAPADRPASVDALLAALGRDPAARLRRVLVAIAVVLAVAAMAVAGAMSWRERGMACQGAEHKLAGAWDAERRQAVERALARGREPLARDTARLVGAALDRYTSSWVAMRTEACEATHVYHEQSEALLDRRMHCLDERLAEVRALTDLLSRPDDALAESAAKAVYTLSPLPACADADALLAPVPPPGDPSSRAQVDALRLELAQLRALKRLKRYQDGERQTRGIVARARRLGYAPLEAEVLLLHADFVQSRGDYATATDTLQEALWAAERGRDRKLAAAALIDLVWVVGVQQGQPRQGHAYARHAEALLRGLGGDAELEANLDEYDASVFAVEGRFDEAEARFRNTAEKRRALFGSAHPGYGAALINLAGVALAQGRKVEALARSEEALAVYRESLGDRHPEYASTLHNSAEVLRQLGRLDEARARAEQALAIEEQALGPEHTLVAGAVAVLGLIALDQKRYPDAERHLRRAIALTEKLHGPEHPVLAERLSNLAQAIVAQGRGADAIPLYRRALAIAAKTQVDPSVTAASQARLGAALLAAKQPGQALPLLLAALDWQEAHEEAAKDLADTRLAASRALWATGRDRERARHLGALAVAGYAAAGASASDDLAAARTWCARIQAVGPGR